MTKEAVKLKIAQLIKEGTPQFERMIETAINSGAIDIEAADDNMIVPKIILTAVYQEMAYQYEPLTKEGKKEVKNLKAFI